jgi:Zn-dependent protease with chaperone function
MAAAWLYDGRSAVRHKVEVERTEAGLRILRESGEAEEVGAAALVHVERRGDGEVYGREDAPGWRLGILRPVPSELAQILPGPQVYGRLVDRVGLGKAVLIGLAASALILFAGYKAPGWLAPLVPFSWEQRFGDAVVGDLGQKFCAGKGGQAALDSIAARLSPDAARLKVRVVDIPIVNAMALPGGNIVIFEDLIAKARSPDEVAGVLAHEIAHVEERHVTEMMIRQYGFSLIISALGGTTGANLDMLATASYSRGSENEADEEAIASLQGANISPLATAGFFGRLAEEESKLGRLARPLAYLSTHPLSEERRRRFAASAETRKRYAPALTPAEWSALNRICRAG